MIRKSFAALALAGSIGFVAAACGGGGSTDLVSEAQSKSKKACECKDLACTTDYIGWFNEVSITKSDELDKLSEADRAKYLEASLAAADCQTALR